MVAITSLQREHILDAVKAMYSDVAAYPDKAYHFPTGRGACLALGYSKDMLAGLPDSAIESFAGVACPVRDGLFNAGDHVLDVGSGSGTDALIAARRAGPGGRVYCLDLTDAMLKKLRENAQISGADQIIALRGNAAAIPLPEASVDVITSNGVLNLVPDKGSAFLELFRVMRPGGRLSLADVAVSKDLSTLEEARDNPRLWAECVVGALDKEQYVAQLEAVGFRDVTIIEQMDYFSHSVSDQTRKIATTFGADSIVLQAIKPDS